MAIKIIQYLISQEPVASWTNEKKEDFFYNLAKSYGYSGDKVNSEIVSFLNQTIINRWKHRYKQQKEIELRHTLVVPEINLDA